MAMRGGGGGGGCSPSWNPPGSTYESLIQRELLHVIFLIVNVEQKLPGICKHLYVNGVHRAGYLVTCFMP